MRGFTKASALAILAAAVAQISSGSKVLGADETVFSITIRNVSTTGTLKFADGKAISAPIAPGLYAVVRGGARLFTPNQAANRALESLAEDGDATALLPAIKATDGVVAADMFAPGLPLMVKAEPGDRLVFASMFVQSNDKFFAPDPVGLEMFEGQAPIAGDLTSKVVLWDAGTERDEAPGIGPNQAPRQTGPNTGPNENATVRPADDGFDYPAVSEVMQITVLPQGAKAKSGS